MYLSAAIVVMRLWLMKVLICLVAVRIVAKWRKNDEHWRKDKIIKET
jgi:hypothetical protein